MPLWLQWALIGVGLLAIVGLSLFIRRQITLLREQKQREDKTRAMQQQRRESMIESVRIIALAVQENQVEYSEACLRLKGLLDHLAPELLETEPYVVLQTVHERLKHMPTHRARKNTERKFVERMDAERFSVEKEFSAAIESAARALRQHDFS